MRRCLFLFVFFMSLHCGVPAFAQMFAGYDEFCGVPVVVEPNPQTASAARDAYGQPVIYIDPSAMGNWSMSRVFALAHECGHHQLGHSTPAGMWFRSTQRWATKEQELEADCWAAQNLAVRGYRQDLVGQYNLFRAQGPFSIGGYPSGWERAEAVAECSNGR